MPKPSPQDMRVSKPLTDFSLAIYNEDRNFAHLQIPEIGVNDRAFLHYVMSMADNMRDSAQLRASSTAAPSDGYDLSTVSQSLSMYSLKQELDIDDLADEDEVLQSEESAVAFLAHKHKLKWEGLLASTVLAGSIWGGTDQTGVSGSPIANQFKQWNDDASTPAKDVLSWHQLIRNRTGMGGNMLLVGDAVDVALRANPDVIDRIKHTGAGGNTNQVTDQALAQYFGVEKYVVSRATRNTAAEGLTATMAQFAGKQALLCYMNPRPAPRTPTAFLKRFWRRMPEGANGMRVSEYFERSIKSQVIEMDTCMGFHVVAADLGQYAGSVVA